MPYLHGCDEARNSRHGQNGCAADDGPCHILHLQVGNLCGLPLSNRYHYHEDVEPRLSGELQRLWILCAHEPRLRMLGGHGRGDETSDDEAGRRRNRTCRKIRMKKVGMMYRVKIETSRIRCVIPALGAVM